MTKPAAIMQIKGTIRRKLMWDLVNRTGIVIAMASTVALLGLILMMLGGATHIAAQSQPTPEAYITVVIAGGDDTVSWSDPDGCSSDYNTYLNVTPYDDDAETSRTHLGSAASGSTEATQSISYSWGGDAPHLSVELYCGAYDASPNQNVLIASTYLSMQGSNLRIGTYSSAPLTVLTISSETLSPAFDRGIYQYTAEVPSDVEVINLDPTVLTGYQTDFVKNPNPWIVMICNHMDVYCAYQYGDGTTTGIVLSDADTNTEGFQVNLDRGENRLLLGVNKGSVGAGVGGLYELTVTVQNSPATGQPTISGTAQVGQTLTADTSGISDADGLTNVAYSYQWLADDTQIDGATSSTYRLQSSNANKVIDVRVTFIDDAGYEESLTSEASGVVAPNVPATGAPTITGTAQVGETLTADASGISDADGLTNVTYNYQWLASRDTEIDGATSSTYSLLGSDEGKTIKVRVSFTDDRGHDEALTSEATTAVEARPNSPATGAPTITGTAQVGETLTANTSSIVDTDGLTNAVYGYQWIRNDGSSDTDIHDETGSTYTVTSAEAAKAIKVRATFTDDAGNEESVVSEETTPVPAIWTGAVTVGNDPNGSGATGYSVFPSGMGSITSPRFRLDDTTNTVTVVAYSEAGLHLGLQYELSTSFTLHVGADTFRSEQASMQEGTSAFIHTWSDHGLNWTEGDELLVVLLEVFENTAATGAPTISGTALVGQTLTASTAGIADTDGLDNVSYIYQWIRSDGSSDADIQGATGSSYTLVDADEGKAIKVKVSFTDDTGNEESLTSAATGVVAARPNSPATGVPSISGTAQVGATLTAGTSGITDADGLTNVSYSYQWLADETDIAGATGASYNLTDSEEGKAIKVKVSFADDAGNEETLTSAATAEVAAAPSPLTVTLENSPASHNGTDAFAFEIRFSEHFKVSYKTLRDHAFSVDGGAVTQATRQAKGSNIGWTITAQPDSNDAVRIVLPATTDCAATGAICTSDGRKLSNRLELTVSGPSS